MPRKIEDISSCVSEVLKEYDRDIWACVEIMKKWKSIGGGLKPKSVSLKDGVLRISTYDSVLRNFLTVSGQKVIEKINREILKEDLVKKIEVFGVNIPIYKRFSTKLKK